MEEFPNDYRCHVRGLRLPATLEQLCLDRVHSEVPLQDALSSVSRLRSLHLPEFGSCELDLRALGLATMTALTSLNLLNTPFIPSTLASSSVRHLMATQPLATTFMLGISASLRDLPQLCELCVEGNLCTSFDLHRAAQQLRGLTMLRPGQGCWVGHVRHLTCLTSLALHGFEESVDFDGLDDTLEPPASLLELRVLDGYSDNMYDPQIRLDLRRCTRLAVLVLQAVSLAKRSLSGLSSSLRHLDMSRCFMGKAELRHLPARLQVAKFDECTVVDAVHKTFRPIRLADLPVAVREACELS